MSTAGSIQSLGGGAPAPEPGRVADIQASIAADSEAAAAFASGPAETGTELIARARAVVSAAPHDEAAGLLSLMRDRLAGLEPARLQPRAGLAGLFDSRNKRLKAFRSSYVSARDAVIAISADLMDRAGAIGRRQAEMETLWTDLRDAVNGLDAHIAAGRAWLADRPSAAGEEAAVPPEAAAAFEDAPEAERDPPIEAEAGTEAALDAAQAEARPEGSETAMGPTEDRPPAGSVTASPHPLADRLETLMALRAQAVALLPVIRAGQNADHAVPAALQSARDQVEAWAADWTEALGLNGKRPRKVSPDRDRLLAGRDALIGSLASAERRVAAAQGRLAELRPRIVTTTSDPRAPA